MGMSVTVTIIVIVIISVVVIEVTEACRGVVLIALEAVRSSCMVVRGIVKRVLVLPLLLAPRCGCCCCRRRCGGGAGAAIGVVVLAVVTL